jgi:hypothetical protein
MDPGSHASRFSNYDKAHDLRKDYNTILFRQYELTLDDAVEWWSLRRVSVHTGKTVLKLAVAELIHLADSAQNLTIVGIFEKPQKTRRSLTAKPQLCARKSNLPRCRKDQTN